jgi:hypothetical protein
MWDMRLAPLLMLLAITAGCTRTVDIEKALTVTEVRTGWYDAGRINGQNKLVPSISLKLRNVDGEPVAGVQLNAIFHRVGEEDGWGEHFVQAIDREGLSAGGSTQEIVLRSNLGYTGDQSRLDLLKNSQFVDARVDIFGKQGRGGWVKLGDFPIDRQLLTQQ